MSTDQIVGIFDILGFVSAPLYLQRMRRLGDPAYQIRMIVLTSLACLAWGIFLLV
jgi:hypothetical protein